MPPGYGIQGQPQGRARGDRTARQPPVGDKAEGMECQFIMCQGAGTLIDYHPLL